MYQTLYFLAEMDDRDIDWIISSGRRRTIAKNNALIYQGSRPEALYIILAGRFTVRIQHGEQLLTVAEVGPEIFWEKCPLLTPAMPLRMSLQKKTA